MPEFPLTYFAQAGFAAFVAALLILMLRRPAERWQLVDVPGGRKRHAAPVAVTGGVAITTAMLLALAASFSAFGQYAAFFVGAVILALTGLLDDLGEVSAGTKMLVQVFVAVLMTSGGANFLVNLGNLFATDPINTRLWAIPLTVFATVAVINAINMFDGLDGLAGSLALVMLCFFTAFALMIGDLNAAKITIVLAGAVIGFLFFNLPWPLRGRHRTFMGDAGSMVLGFAIAWFSVSLSQHHVEAVSPPDNAMGSRTVIDGCVYGNRPATGAAPQPDVTGSRSHSSHPDATRLLAARNTCGAGLGQRAAGSDRYRSLAARCARLVDFLVVSAGVRNLLRGVFLAVPTLSISAREPTTMTS